MGCRVRVADAVCKRRRGHFADRHHVGDSRVLRKLAQELVDVPPIRVEAPSVSLEIILEDCRLGNEVHDVEAEAFQPLCLPEADHVLQLLADTRVLPVEVGLCFIKEVEIVLVEGRNVLPGRAAEFRDPVRRNVGRGEGADLLRGGIRSRSRDLIGRLRR